MSDQADALTTLNHKKANPTSKHFSDHSSRLIDVDFGWVLPFLHIWLPESSSFATRGDCLVPSPISSDTDVLGEEEAQDDGDLVAYEHDCGV